jgi:hypothetical protein
MIVNDDTIRRETEALVAQAIELDEPQLRGAERARLAEALTGTLIAVEIFRRNGVAPASRDFSKQFQHHGEPPELLWVRSFIDNHQRLIALIDELNVDASAGVIKTVLDRSSDTERALVMAVNRGGVRLQ